MASKQKKWKSGTLVLPLSAGHPRLPKPRATTAHMLLQRCAAKMPGLNLNLSSALGFHPHHHLLTVPTKSQAQRKGSLAGGLVGALGLEAPAGCSQAGCSWSILHLDWTTRVLSPQQSTENKGSASHPFLLVVLHLCNPGSKSAEKKKTHRFQYFLCLC